MFFCARGSRRRTELFRIIAFSLAHTYKKERGNLYLLLVPHFEAFALPFLPERATQKPTPICVYTISLIAGTRRPHQNDITYPVNIYCCLVL